jgi:hypothetical protein
MRPPNTLDYSPPSVGTFHTTPLTSPAQPGRSRMAEHAAEMSTLHVGMFVSVAPCSPALRGKTGVIVAVDTEDNPIPDGDCLVQLDGRDRPIGFYYHELVVIQYHHYLAST